jgi:hypothetical protein
MSRLLVGGIALGGGVLIAASQAGAGLSAPVGEGNSGGATAPASDTRPVGSASVHEGWVWPLPRYKSGHAPDISDGPGNNKRDGGSRSHNGADIDYKRKSKSELIEVYRPGSAEGSPGGWYFCPRDTPVLAARDGFLWSCTDSDRGIQIVIDHGKPFATYYQHMSRVFMPRAKRGEQRIAIKAGQVIGIVGNGSPPSGRQPVNAFIHLHFEIWKDGGADRWIDPTAILRAARVIAWSDVRIPA